MANKRKKLHEAPPIDYSGGPERMSPDIERKLRSQEHPLGGHPAFPDVDGDGVVVGNVNATNVSKSFNENNANRKSK